MSDINILCEYCRDGLGKTGMEHWHLNKSEREVHGDEDEYILWVARGRRPRPSD